LPPRLESVYPIIRVRDLARSLEFYEGLLGMTRTYQWPEEGQPDFAVVAAGEDKLGIGGATADYVPDDRYELCFLVDDVDGIVEELRAGGATVEHEPEDMPWGERMSWVLDPDGNRLHLRAPSSETVTSS